MVKDKKASHNPAAIREAVVQTEQNPREIVAVGYDSFCGLSYSCN